MCIALNAINAICALLFVMSWLHASVEWLTDFNKALSIARQRRQKIAAFIYDADCKGCVESKELMFSPDSVRRLMSQFVCVLLDVNGDGGRKIWEQYIVKQTDVLPAMLFFTSDGKLIDFVTGYIPEGSLIALLNQVSKGITVNELLRRVRSNPNDINAAYQVAIAFLERDQIELAMPFVERVTKLTKGKGKHFAALSLHLGVRHAYLGQTELAKKYLSMAASQSDDLPVAEEAQFQLAVVYYAINQLGEAARLCERLIKAAKRRELAELSARLLQTINQQTKGKTESR